MINKFYYEYIIDEIIEIIKTNLYIYYNSNNSLLQLKKYCENKEDDKYRNLDYSSLICFVQEALTELLTCEYLYDFRMIE